MLFLTGCFHFFGRPRTRGYVIPEIPGVQRRQVLEGTFAFADTVRPVRITHQLEDLPVFHEFIDQRFGILVMYVVITRAMDQIADRLSGLWHGSGPLLL